MQASATASVLSFDILPSLEWDHISSSLRSQEKCLIMEMEGWGLEKLREGDAQLYFVFLFLHVHCFHSKKIQS